MGITQREANFKFNMKLIAGLFAAVLAIDCPNNGWEANSDDNECIPATNTVSITCNADTMVVTLDARHLYVEMDASHVDDAASAAFVGSCTSSTYNSADGTYTITVPLDDCGTDVSQTGGEITFANTIYGSDGAITVDGIIITEKLELSVKPLCFWSKAKCDINFSQWGSDTSLSTFECVFTHSRCEAHIDEYCKPKRKNRVELFGNAARMVRRGDIQGGTFS